MLVLTSVTLASSAPVLHTLFPYTTLFRSGDMYVDGHKAASDVRDEFVSVTEKLMDELAQCYNVLPQLDINSSRSEERFSRNAETDLVCRLLLEKKINLQHQLSGDIDLLLM